MNVFSEIAECKINTQKFLYANDKHTEKESRKQPHSHSFKIINSKQEKNKHNKNFKTLNKEIEEDTRRRKKSHMFMNW